MPISNLQEALSAIADARTLLNYVKTGIVDESTHEHLRAAGRLLEKAQGTLHLAVVELSEVKDAVKLLQRLKVKQAAANSKTRRSRPPADADAVVAAAVRVHKKLATVAKAKKGSKPYRQKRS